MICETARKAARSVLARQLLHAVAMKQLILVLGLLVVGCKGETEFQKLEKQACSCKTRDCARAADKKLEKLLMKAFSADDPKAAAEANMRAFDCIQRVQRAS